MLFNTLRVYRYVRYVTCNVGCYDLLISDINSIASTKNNIVFVTESMDDCDLAQGIHVSDRK